MKILVTGSSGHLGEALVRTLRTLSHEVVGLDLTASPFTSHVGCIVDRGFVRQCMQGVDAVLHTATLHKPHLVTHSPQDFVDTNITGTLNLLQAAASGVDLQDVVDAHLRALDKAPLLGFGRYIITATTPFQPDDLLELPVNAPGVVRRRVPDSSRTGWLRVG